jgi:hypothetical protein
MTDRDRAAAVADAQLDTKVPHSARVWNYWLGGKDNYQADRDVGDQFEKLYPDITVVARSSRAFLKRAVTFLAADGLRQFLDIGTGMPTAENTHQVAQSVAPESRIVYVDNDPLVLVHARALLTGTEQGATAYIDADLHDPAGIVDAARNGPTLDFTRPIGLILMNILGHVPDLDEAVSIVRRLVDEMPPGSYLVTADGTNVIDGPAFEEAIAVWNANAPLSYHLRHPDQLARFLTGLEVVEPGLVPCSRWRPAPDAGPEELREVDEYGAVARKS